MLSLFCTIIEGARVSTAKVFAERALTTAMDSVFAEYYGPLWEEYHIFGYNLGNESGVQQKELIEEKLSEYMSYTFTPNQNQEASSDEEGIDLYNLSIAALSVNDQTKLMDYNGELMINEAVEYMKYKEIGKGLELLLDKMSMLETPKNVSVIYEEKQKVENELVELDKGILQLMELLDGIETNDNGIELSDSGKLQVNEYFVKKICFNPVTKEAVGINNDQVLLVLKDKYTNPIPMIEGMKDTASQLIQISEQMNSVKSQMDSVEVSLQNAQASLNKLNSIKKKSLSVKKQIKVIQSNMQYIEKQREELQTQLNNQEETKKQLTASIDTTMNSVNMLINELNPLLVRAISITDNLQYKAGISGDLVSEYEEALNNQKEDIREDIFAGLEEGLQEMKRYTASEEGGYDFIAMLDELNNDHYILTEVKRILGRGAIELDGDQFQALVTTFTNAQEKMENYETNDLVLDYSTLILNKSEKDNPMDKAGNLLKSGITDLVIDKSSLSDKELMKDQLPSVTAALSSQNTDFTTMISKFFENSMAGLNNDGRSDVFYNFYDTSQSIMALGEGINQIAEILLFQEYLKEHFESFPMVGEDTSVRKPSALSYEQEYLLVGKTSDQENIFSVVSRIVFMRMLMDFVSLLGDKTKCSEAKLAATALVGLTGLPILISITQTVILLVWSFMEALLDTCALLIGKEVPIIKKKIALEFTELFLVNRTFLQSKAAKFTQTKELSFSYKDYLRIFLLIKNKKVLACRSMDLMQENINLRYEEQFNFQNCIYGLLAEANFSVKSKFTAISFVEDNLGKNIEGFSFSTKAAYSY